MSANAVFIRLQRVDLEELVEAASEDDPQALQAFLNANGSSVADFDYDGEIFSTLIPVLAEEYDIDLETSENEIVADLAEVNEALVIILTLEDQKKYLAKLAPDKFTESKLGKQYEAFAEEEDEEAGEMMLAGITTLHQCLMEVDIDHVVVISVG